MATGVQSAAKPVQTYWDGIRDTTVTVVRGTAGALAGAATGYVTVSSVALAVQTVTFVNPYSGAGTLGGKIVYNLVGIALWPTLLAAVGGGAIYGGCWAAAPVRTDH